MINSRNLIYTNILDLTTTTSLDNRNCVKLSYKKQIKQFFLPQF